MKPTTRNYCREMAIMHANKVYKSKGTTDEDLLTGSVFHIMFLNYFTETYIFEAVNAIKGSRFYRQDVKQLTNKLDSLTNKQNKELAVRLGEYADRFADINLVFEDAFEEKMAKLKESISNVIREHTNKCDSDISAMSRVVLATMITAFAAQNVTDRINECKHANPIVLQMKWSNHDIIYKLLNQICSKIGVPIQVTTDLTINSKFYNIEKLWHDPVFLASLLSEGDEVSADLSEIYANN